MLFNQLNEVFQTIRREATAYGETNDCGVIAIAIATGKPYKEVHGLMARHGRKARRGSPIDAMKKTIRDLGFKIVIPHDQNSELEASNHSRGKVLKQSNGRNCYTPRTILKVAKPTGKYIAITRSHALAVANREVVDWTEGRRHVIKHWWQIVPSHETVPAVEVKPVERKVVAPVERKVGAKVRVCGVTYRSVKMAFIALGLDLKKHQKFRYELKRSSNGRLEFSGFTFEVAA